MVSITATSPCEEAHQMDAVTSQTPTSAPANPIDHLSFSAVETFIRCPLQWHFGYKLRLPPLIVPASLVFGSAFHHALEVHFRAKAEGRQASIDEMLGAWDAKWRAEVRPIRLQLAKGETVSALRNMAASMLPNVIEQGAKLSAIVGVEHRFNARIADSLPPFHGVIDLMAIGKQGNTDALHIIDFKTAARMPTACSPRSPDQLILYAKALENLVAEFEMPLALSFWTVTKRATPELHIETVTYSKPGLVRVIAKAEAAYQGMTSGKPYPCPGWQCESGCGYKHLCQRWPNLDSIPANAEPANVTEKEL